MLEAALQEAEAAIDRTVRGRRPRIASRETGRVVRVGKGVAQVRGLPGLRAQELVSLGDGVLGIAFNLDPEEAGVVLLDDSRLVGAGTEARRTGRVVDVPVGPGLLGRVVDGTGRPMDDRGPVHSEERRPVEREAPVIIERAPVTTPLETGFKVIDALIPIGRGQRQLILGDRQTGKSTVAVDTILNQRDKDLICVYCAVGQQGSAVARVIQTLRAYEAMGQCIVVVARAEDPPGLQFIAPYAATTIAEYFMERGRDVLVVYDDLTRHAHTYRELSLLLRRPPGREAYPGDIFYIHSRLLERSTRLCRERGGGSLTALPIVETESQNIAAYIPTNLISITDGQIYLSPDLFQKGILPAVDVGKSVSRVGGKAQLPAYLDVVGDLRLSYAQFVELEVFARFGTRLDEATRGAIERGRRVREALKQAEHALLTPCEQMVVLLAVVHGLFDSLPLDRIATAEKALHWAVADYMGELCRKIHGGERLNASDLKAFLEGARAALHTEGRVQVHGGGDGPG